MGCGPVVPPSAVGPSSVSAAPVTPSRPMPSPVPSPSPSLPVSGGAVVELVWVRWVEVSRFERLVAVAPGFDPEGRDMGNGLAELGSDEGFCGLSREDIEVESVPGSIDLGLVLDGPLEYFDPVEL